jgi:hypothetical protein
LLFLEQFVKIAGKASQAPFWSLFFLGHARWATPHHSDAQENPLPIEIHCQRCLGEIFASRMIKGSEDASGQPLSQSDS